MTDIRGLRLSLEAKLEERRVLLRDNATLQSRNLSLDAHNRVMSKVLNSPLANRAMDKCADDIIDAVLAKAIEASAAIAEQSRENGVYIVGIDIPMFSIRMSFCRQDLEDRFDPYSQAPQSSLLNYP